jgi:transposase
MMIRPTGVRVWLAAGATDMRRGMNGLALQVQEALRRDPHAGDLYVFRGKRGNLLKILWHDGLGLSLYAKRLERGRFIWPSRAMVWLLSRRCSSATCWRGSTGGTRSGRGDQRWLVDAASVATTASRFWVHDHLKLLIAKLRHDRLGASSERGRKLLDQMELELEELEAGLPRMPAAQQTMAWWCRPSPGANRCARHCPSICRANGWLFPRRVRVRAVGASSPSWGETITESLESIPRQWQVVQTVREKFTRRSCETITQPPAPQPDTIPPWRAGVADRRGHFIFNDRRELPCQAASMTCSPRPWPVASRSCVAMTDAPANSVQSSLAIPKARRKRSPTSSADKADPVCLAVVNGDASGWIR